MLSGEWIKRVRWTFGGDVAGFVASTYFSSVAPLLHDRVWPRGTIQSYATK